MPWLATVSAFASPQPTWGSIRPQRSRPFPLINRNRTKRRPCLRRQLSSKPLHPPASTPLRRSPPPPPLTRKPPQHRPPPPSPSKTQPLYRTWSLILGTLAILATVAFSFMVGSRLGWLVSSSPPAQVPVPRASKSDAARPRAKPAAHTRKSTSLSRTARSTSSAQPVPTHSADDLVVYDHGKVIFRAKPSTKKSGASPVVDAS